jgi:hypothetical protein
MVIEGECARLVGRIETVRANLQNAFARLLERNAVVIRKCCIEEDCGEVPNRRIDTVGIALTGIWSVTARGAKLNAIISSTGVLISARYIRAFCSVSQDR